MRNIFRVLLTASRVCCALGAFAGTTTYSFDWYRNAAQTDFQVPIALEEGVSGFTYSDAAADGADLCVTDAGGTVQLSRATIDGQVSEWFTVLQLYAAALGVNFDFFGGSLELAFFFRFA